MPADACGGIAVPVEVFLYLQPWALGPRKSQTVQFERARRLG